MRRIATILLSLVLVLETVPAATAYAAAPDTSERVKAAEERLNEANANLERAQNEYDGYLEDDPQIEEHYIEAQTAVTEAEEALRQAELELESAQSAYDSANSTYLEKESAKSNAQSEYDSALQTKNEKAAAKAATEAALTEAQETYEAALESMGDDPDVKNASAELEAAKEAVSVAEAKVQEKTEALQTAQTEAAQAAAAKNAADSKVANAKAAEKPYEDAVSSAQKAVDTATAAKEAADGAVTSAQAEYDEAAQAATDKQAEIESTESRIGAAQEGLAQANANKQQGQTNLDAAEEAKEEALANKAAAERALEEYKNSIDEKLNAYDFFVWLSNNADQTNVVKESAAVAARMLKNQATSTDLSKIENDGSISSSSSLKKSYSEIIGCTNIGKEGDATNWDNFKYALDLVQKGNEYRAKENLSPLTVSSVMMAMGEINANYQLSIDSISHTSAFLALENLAYNSAGSMASNSYPEPDFKSYDPFDGWYTKEKKIYDYITAHNYDYGSLTPEQKKEIQEACELESPDEVQVGHYLTLTDRNGGIPMISSGFGYVNSFEQSIKDGWFKTSYKEKYSHMFGFSDSYASGQDGIPVADFKALVTTYEDSVGEIPESLTNTYNEAAAAVSKADADIAAANEAIEAAEAAITSNTNELAAANAELETKQAELTALESTKTVKENNLQAAKGEQEAKATELETAKGDLTRAQSELSAKQEETRTAEAEANEAAAAAETKQTALNVAQGEKDEADEELQEAKSAETVKQGALDAILEQKNAEAVNALNIAKTNDDNAAEELSEAEEILATKEANLSAANEALESATTARDTAAQTVTAKENAKVQAADNKTEAENSLKSYENYVNAKEALANAKEAVEEAKAAFDEAKAEEDRAAAAEAKKNEEARKAEEARKLAEQAELDRQGYSDSTLPKVKIAKPKAAKKAAAIKWKKLNKKQLKKSQAQKIEIWVCPNGAFGSNDTIMKMAGKKKASLKVKGLQKGATYFVKVRAIKYVGGTKMVGPWSKVKKVKIKK